MNVLLFTGAGFSKALNLPTTTDFRDQISRLPTDIKTFIQSYLGSSSDDIEKVLFALDEFSNRNSLLYHILKTRAQANPKSPYQSVFDEMSSMISLASTHSNNIKRSLYTTLNKFDVTKAVELYKNILLELKNDTNNEFRLSFFTTNYDLTFEKFLLNQGDFLKEELGIEKIEFGFNAKYGTNIFDPTIKCDWDKSTIEYQKLHGSLDWIKDGELCVKSGASLSPNSPSETPLLYPGYKETPTSEPFITIHHNLSEKLLSASVVIVVGFAFRDSYINSIFESFLKSNPASINVLCYNPQDGDQLPIDSKILYFKNKYKSFKHLVTSLENKECPLDLDHNL